MKDPRWMPKGEVLRVHNFANLALRTVHKWLTSRCKFMRDHPELGECVPSAAAFAASESVFAGASVGSGVAPMDGDESGGAAAAAIAAE